MRRADAEHFAAPLVRPLFFDDPHGEETLRHIEVARLWAPPGRPISAIPALVSELTGLRVFSIGPGAVTTATIDTLGDGDLPPGLQELSVHTGAGPVRWPGVVLPELRRLHVDGVLRFDPGCFPKLEAIALSADKGLHNVSSALTLPVTDLDLLGFPVRDRLFDTLGSRPLRHLGLYGSRSLRDLDGIEHLIALESLRLKNLPSLTDVSRIALLTGLVELDVQYCRRISGIDVLTELRRLRSLTMVGCGEVGLDRIAPLLRRLEHVNTGGTF